jgi:transcriptional regulator with XRE-family HTH domain
MSAIERGVSGATLSQLQKLCEILNVSADQLLFGTEQADDETTAMVKRLLRVPPEYRKQLYQIIAASLEILKIETKE